MRVFLDCLPCMVRQILDASRMGTDDIVLQQEIMEEALAVVCRYREYPNPPEIARDIHRIVKRKTGRDDPYKAEKDDSIASALSLYPFLERYLDEKRDKLYWALKAAATGNIIDAAIFRDITIDEGIVLELEKPFAICDIDAFRETMDTAKSLLIIADNAGETVFDRLLIERIEGLSVTYAVRDKPNINDATIEDARASGIEGCARILSTGCDAPGIIFEECSDEFLGIYRDADLVISKGQANFETLSGADREIFFLLKAKCPLIASHLHAEVGQYVFLQNTGHDMDR